MADDALSPEQAALLAHIQDLWAKLAEVPPDSRTYRILHRQIRVECAAFKQEEERSRA